MSNEIENRREVLLRAAYDLLTTIHNSCHGDALGETAFYDGADCDGHCLVDDIGIELGLDDGTEPLKRTSLLPERLKSKGKS